MLAVMVRPVWLALLLSGTTLSCGSSANARADLTVAVEDLDVEITPALVGAFLTGSFKLQIDLAADAPGAVLIPSAPSFKLLGSDGASVLDSLQAAPTVGSFPLELEPGVSHPVLFDVTRTALSDDASGSVCKASPVRVSGSIADGEQQKANFSSSKLAVVGCL